MPRLIPHLGLAIGDGPMTTTACGQPVHDKRATDGAPCLQGGAWAWAERSGQACPACLQQLRAFLAAYRGHRRPQGAQNRDHRGRFAAQPLRRP